MACTFAAPASTIERVAADRQRPIRSSHHMGRGPRHGLQEGRLGRLDGQHRWGSARLGARQVTADRHRHQGGEPARVAFRVTGNGVFADKAVEVDVNGREAR